MVLAHGTEVLCGVAGRADALGGDEVSVGEVCSRMHGVSKLVSEVVGPTVQGHVASGMGCCGIDVGPIDSPAGVTKHLIEEHALAAAVAVAERVDEGQFGPVRGDGVGGDTRVGGAGWP